MRLIILTLTVAAVPVLAGVAGCVANAQTSNDEGSSKATSTATAEAQANPKGMLSVQRVVSNADGTRTESIAWYAPEQMALYKARRAEGRTRAGKALPMIVEDSACYFDDVMLEDYLGNVICFVNPGVIALNDLIDPNAVGWWDESVRTVWGAAGDDTPEQRQGGCDGESGYLATDPNVWPPGNVCKLYFSECATAPSDWYTACNHANAWTLVVSD